MANKKKNFKYQDTHRKIENFILEFIRDHKGFPTEKEIADGTDVSIRTVRRHKKDLTLTHYLPMFKELTPKIITALGGNALSGRVPAVKLWMQIVEGWNEKQIREHEGTVTITVGLPEEMQDEDTNED